MSVLDLTCSWLEKTGRIKDPARGTPERRELVDAFKTFVIKSSARRKP